MSARSGRGAFLAIHRSQDGLAPKKSIDTPLVLIYYFQKSPWLWRAPSIARLSLLHNRNNGFSSSERICLMACAAISWGQSDFGSTLVWYGISNFHPSSSICCKSKNITFTATESNLLGNLVWTRSCSWQFLTEPLCINLSVEAFLRNMSCRASHSCTLSDSIIRAISYVCHSREQFGRRRARW